MDVTGRHGDWMQTFTGRAFWPLDPRPDEVHLPDIAHALAHQCRYGGHARRFYSVAEHCVLISRALEGAGTAAQLWALLHDAAEAYVVDVPRPLKHHLPGYKTAEAAVMLAICARFGLSPEMPGVVQEADERILRDELEQAMAPPPARWPVQDLDPLGVTLRFWSPVAAELEFIAAFDRLTGGRFAANDAFTAGTEFSRRLRAEARKARATHG